MTGSSTTSTRIVTNGLALVIALGALAARPSAEVTVYMLTLKDAFRPQTIRPGGIHLQVALEYTDGALSETVGLCPMYAREASSIDAAGMTVSVSALEGEIKTVVKDYKDRDVACAYTLTASVVDGEIVGSYQGAFGETTTGGGVVGTVMSNPDYHSLLGAELYLQHALVAHPGENPQDKWEHAHVSALLQDGSAFFTDMGNAYIPRGLFNNHYYEYQGKIQMFTSHGPLLFENDQWYATGVRSTLSIDAEGNLSGVVYDTVAALAPDRRFVEGPYEYRVRGRAIGRLVHGTFSVSVNGTDRHESVFIGELVDNPRTPANPRNSVYSVRILAGIAQPQASGVSTCVHDGCAPMKFYMNVENGSVTEVVAHSWYNRMAYPVEIGSFVIDEDHIDMSVTIDVPPDPAISFPPQNVRAAYTLDLSLGGELVSGTFTGAFNGESREGRVVGRYVDRDSLDEPGAILGRFRASELTGTRPMDPALSALAQEDALKPVIAGDRLKTVFWNDFRYDYRGLAGGLSHHIFAPNFSFSPVADAAKYRFGIAHDGRTLSFEAPNPFSTLAPIWDSIPATQTAVYTVTCEALGAEGAVIDGSREERPFVKRPAFRGPYAPSPSNRKERTAAYLHSYLGNLWNAAYRSEFSTAGIADRTTRPQPVRTIATLTPLCRLVETTPSALIRERALRILRNNGMSWKRYSSLQPRYLVPGHWKGEYWMGIYGAIAMLELYRVTKEETWLDVAKLMASSIRSLQRPDGDLGWMGEPGCGEVPFETINPAPYLYFFGKLRVEAGVNDYVDAERRAYEWLLNNTAKSLEWPNLWGCSHHFNYLNFHSECALFFCSYMLEFVPDEEKDWTLLYENARWVEDQFVAWNRYPRAYNYRITPPVPPYSDSFIYFISSATNAWLAYVYLHLHNHSSDTLLYAKAEALIDNALWAQDALSGYISPVFHHASVHSSGAWEPSPETITALFLPASVEMLEGSVVARRDGGDRTVGRRTEATLGLTARGAALRLDVEVGRAEQVSLAVYDMRGRRIYSSGALRARAGRNVFTLDTPRSTGSYLARVRIGEQIHVERMPFVAMNGRIER